MQQKIKQASTMNIPLACSDVKAPFSTPSPSLSPLLYQNRKHSKVLSRMKIRKVLTTTSESKNSKYEPLQNGYGTYSVPQPPGRIASPNNFLIKERKGNFRHWGVVVILESIQISSTGREGCEIYVRRNHKSPSTLRRALMLTLKITVAPAGIQRLY